MCLKYTHAIIILSSIHAVNMSTLILKSQVLFGIKMKMATINVTTLQP